MLFFDLYGIGGTTETKMLVLADLAKVVPPIFNTFV